jgi:ATP-dependent DNA helicase HFM1/MER3
MHMFAQIARWLGVPPAGLRQYGDELRPCTLTTHVKGYAPAKNDFLFERRLNDHVFAIISAHSKGRPALVFCRCARVSAVEKSCQQAHSVGRLPYL